MLVYSLLLLFALQLISVYLVQSLEQYYLHNFKTGLEYQARLLASFLEPFIRDEPESSDDIANLVREFSGLRKQRSLFWIPLPYLLSSQPGRRPPDPG